MSTHSSGCVGIWKMVPNHCALEFRTKKTKRPKKCSQEHRNASLLPGSAQSGLLSLYELCSLCCISALWKGCKGNCTALYSTGWLILLGCLLCQFLPGVALQWLRISHLECRLTLGKLEYFPGAGQRVCYSFPDCWHSKLPGNCH